LEVSIHTRPDLGPAARDELDLQDVKRNVNLCRATVAVMTTVRYHAGQNVAGIPALRPLRSRTDHRL
jgi:hypothetical protein